MRSQFFQRLFPALGICVMAVLVYLFSGGATVARSDSPTGSAMSAAETKFRDEMGLAKYNQVEYRDTKGAAVDFAKFQQLQGQAPNFSITKIKNDKVAKAVISLQSEAIKPEALKYKLKPGAKFPAFRLAASDGATVDNAALLGRYTVINFYFADCAPCVKEIPMLNAFAAAHKDIAALAVTFDSAADTKAFADSTQFKWRTLAGAGSLIEQVGVTGFPSFALVDQKGVLVAIGNQGDIGSGKDSLEKWISRQMGKKSI